MTTDLAKLHQEVKSELGKQVARLSELGVQWLSFDSDPLALQHIKERHFSGGDVPGSKFSSTLSDEQIAYIVQTGELAAVTGLVKQLQNGAEAKPGLRAEAAKDFSEVIGAVGSDVLIERDKYPEGVVVHRNPGNPRDVAVYLKPVADQEIPKTSKVTYIGGIYGQEDGKPLTAGFYTFFPGANAPPMTNTQFWDAHGFLATKREMGALIGKLSKDPAMAEEAAMVRRVMNGGTPKAAQPTRPQEAKPVPGNIALAVPPDIQMRLKEVVEPRYSKFFGEHVTIKTGAKQPSSEADAVVAKFKDALVEAYGVADDGRVQCLLLRVNGEERNPNNGRPYHLTWSLNPDADVPADYNDNGKPGKGKISKVKPVHSGVIADRAEFVTRFDEPVKFKLAAAFFPQVPNANAVQVPVLAK